MSLSLTSRLDGVIQSLRRLLARPARAKKSSVATGAPTGDRRGEQRDRVRRMRRDLYQLLELHPRSRELMRHLGLVEHTLQREGVAGMEALPTRVVATALTQLERLVWDWTPAGLAELRSRMAVIVRNGPARDALELGGAHGGDNEAPNTDSFAPHLAMHAAADVTEVEHDDFAAFEEMERSWAGRMPAAVAKAMAAKEPSTA